MASSALADSMVGGLEPSSQNSAHLKSWPLTLSPRSTLRPFILFYASPSSSSMPLVAEFANPTNVDGVPHLPRSRTYMVCLHDAILVPGT